MKFMPRTTIKVQALADFIAEFTYLTTTLGGAIDKSRTSMEHKKDIEFSMVIPFVSIVISR